MPEVAEALPQDLETPSAVVIVLFHDETTFQACDYDCTQWGNGSKKQRKWDYGFRFH